MPRLPRIDIEGAIYYVTSRAVQNEEIFKDKEDYKMYLDLVNKYKAQHKFKLFSYCLLPDRLELLIETGDDLPGRQAGASISEIMHDLNSLYTKYFNGRYQKRGHVFESRFRSVFVEKAHYLVAMTRHLHRASAQHEKTSSLPLKEYPYSSFHIYLQEAGKVSPVDAAQPDLSHEVKEVMEFLQAKDDPSKYEKYVLEPDPKEIEFLEKGLRRGQVLGSDEFHEEVKKKVQEYSETQNEGTEAQKPSPVLLYLIGGLVVVATASIVYLYISKTNLENKYETLVNTKETEFLEKAKFENQSPLTLTELDGTEWEIETVPASPGGAVSKDRLLFESGRFQSEALAEKGFYASNYFLSPQAARVVKWQTSQSNPSGDTAIWSGTWQGDAMKGTLTVVSRDHEETYTFFSLRWNYRDEREPKAERGGVR